MVLPVTRNLIARCLPGEGRDARQAGGGSVFFLPLWREGVVWWRELSGIFPFFHLRYDTLGVWVAKVYSALKGNIRTIRILIRISDGSSISN